MSEVKNSTTDIDNNVQEEPKSTLTPTPKKRLSRAEKARLESEELLKSFGVTMEVGRQTRSSRRGTAVESPKPVEPLKRKQTNTPRRPKKAKITETDSTDGTNHSHESNENEVEVVPAQTEILNKAGKNSLDAAEKAAKETRPVSNNGDSGEKMEVDTPIESTQSAESPKKTESVPQSETIEQSLPSNNQAGSVPPKAVEEPKVLESDGVSAAADTTTTTTTIIIDSEPEPIVSEPDSVISKSAKSKFGTEPVEIESDTDQNEESVSNSQIIIESDAVVELDTSSNDGEDGKVETVNKTQELNSLELELINSDSSHSEKEIQIVESPEQAAQAPTSTVEAVTEVTKVSEAVKAKEAVEKTNNIADKSVHSNEPPKKLVESTNNQKPVEIPVLRTIAADNPREETITTTSETLLQQPKPTTA